MSTGQLGTTIVVPVRHEANNIVPLLQRLRDATAGRGPMEVLFIDDSDDRKTGAVICRASRTRSHLRVRYIHRIGSVRWGGLAGAVVDGMREALGTHVVVMDGDLQHPPEHVPSIMARMVQVEPGSDIVVASRYCEGGSNDGLDGGLRRFVSRTATMLSRVLFPRGLRGVTDPMTGFFGVRKDALDLDALAQSNGFKILLEILALHPHATRDEVPLNFQCRADGQSKSGEGNGIAFARQLLRLRLKTLPTWANFALGGGLIAGLGALLLMVMTAMGVPAATAEAIMMGTTLVLNFLYNRYITWSLNNGKSLRYQVATYAATRATTQALGWGMFVGLMAVGLPPGLFSHFWRAQAANVVVTAAVTVLNFLTSKYLVFLPATMAERQPSAWRRPVLLLAGLAAFAGVQMVVISVVGVMSWFMLVMLGFTSFSLITSCLELRWRLYGRRTPEAQEQMKFEPAIQPADAKLSFSIIVAALREAVVIRRTVQQLLRTTHPNVQIVVSLVKGDTATIAAVEPLLEFVDPVRLILVIKTYPGKGSKARQLNEGLKYCTSDYVGVVDAETYVPEDLMLHAEPTIRKHNADVLQGGVQLVNTGLTPPATWDRLQGHRWLHGLLAPFFTSKLWAALRGWYCAHNGLEYAFWFGSRMFFQIDQGFVPLGGNTLFIRRTMLEGVGGWEDVLTEDCELGVRLSLKGAKIVAAYQPELASREETPPRIFGAGGHIRQRTRWDQGFLQVLLGGSWWQLPKLKDRLMAVYILGMPMIQALNGLFVPLAIVGVMALTTRASLALAMFLPFIPMLLTILTQALGLAEFGRDFQQKIRPWHYASIILGAPLYQLLLAWPAMVAIWRYAKGANEWALTQHDGQGQHADPDDDIVMGGGAPELVAA